MNSKEALETLGNVEVAVTTIRSGRTHFKTLKEQYEKEFEVIERELFIKKEFKDFDVFQKRLEQLEIANKNNEGLVRENVELINRNLKLQDEYQKLKERYKKRAALSKELCEGLKTYEKAFDILIDKFEVVLCKSDFPIPEIKYSFGFKFRRNCGAYVHISQEEYEILKSVLEGE